MAAAGSKEAKQLEQIKNTFDKAYKEMGKASEADSDLTTEVDSNIKYDISKDLYIDLESVLDNTFPSNKTEVYIGETSDFLVEDLGFEPLSITMPPNKAYSAMVTEEEAKNDGRYDSDVNYHGLGKEGLINVLEASENPIIAYVSKNEESVDGKNRGDSVVLVTNEYDSEGNNIVVIEKVSIKGFVDSKKATVNKAITSYGKNYIEGSIKDAFADNRILFVDKKRSLLTVRGERLQLPNSLYGNDFTNNIDNFWANVNYLHGKAKLPEPKKNVYKALGEKLSKAMNDKDIKYSLSDNQGRQLTKEQQEYFKDSKVRDENGNLLTVYHGSKNKFNEFTSDINWFSSSKEYSNNYGKEANLFNKVTKTEPKESKVTFETHLNIKILIWPKMNLFLLKQKRRRLNPKAVLPTSVKLYANGERLQGYSPEGFTCLEPGRILALAFSQGTKYVLTKEKPWATVFPNDEKKLALGEEARSGSPGGSESACEGRTIERYVLPGEKECIRREKP